jgi:hypothetical protein
MLLPDGFSSALPASAVAGGKDGLKYLLNRDNSAASRRATRAPSGGP